MTQRFTIDSLEALIRFLKAMSHEPHGKPAARGVAASNQVLLRQARAEWKRQAAANKAKKKNRTEVGG